MSVTGPNPAYDFDGQVALGVACDVSDEPQVALPVDGGCTAR